MGDIFDQHSVVITEPNDLVALLFNGKLSAG